MTDRPRARVLLVGPPNAGKSSLFNRLTGAAASTGNYAGTTVGTERAPLALTHHDVEMVDLPGTTSLVSQAADEAVTVRALLDLSVAREPGAVLLVLDGPRLTRSLYLALQVLGLELPVVVAVNLADEARDAGRPIDGEALSRLLGVSVVVVSARTGEGVDALRGALDVVLTDPDASLGRLVVPLPAALSLQVDAVAAALEPWALGTGPRERAIAEWALQSEATDIGEDRPLPDALLASARAEVEAAGRDLDVELASARYAWIDARIAAGNQLGSIDATSARTEAIDAVLLHPLSGSVAFFGVMWLVFLALFSWSDPLIGIIEDSFTWLGELVTAGFEGPIAGAGAGAVALGVLRDLIVQGLIGGVGAVLVFLPQIAILFLLLALLEDCGYLARAAALIDRVLRAAGLPGQAFVPLLSGYACAVPAVLSTRSIPRWRDRVLTMAVIPLTSCSARLPVYTLMIAVVFPASLPGWPLPIRPTALMAMYLFSTVVTLLAAVVLGRTLYKGDAAPSVLELPPYRMPIARNVFRTVWSRAKDFVQEAGRVILVATVVLWALLSFPRATPEAIFTPAQIETATAAGQDLEALAAPYQLEHSIAGRIGKAIEPAIQPLGFDWKIGVGMVGAFAAREVFVSTLGVIYGVEDADEEDADLRTRLRADHGPDGEPVWTPLTGASVMVFFALAMQCLSTLAVLRKETGGWRVPAAVGGYMTVLAYVASLIVYQGGLLLGLH